MRSLIVCFLLCACARLPNGPERWNLVDQVAAVSLLGDELRVDVHSRSLLQPMERSLDVAGWHTDATFRDLLSARLQDRQRQVRAFELEPQALEKAVRVRESRWRRVEGKHSQALLDLLFREADRQGIRYFFLLTAPGEPDHFPRHRGTYGVFCDDRTDREARASVYFYFDFSFWEVASRRKLFSTPVDPKVTEALTFDGCARIAELKDPVRELEDPLKKTAELIVDALFDKMSWRRPGQ